MSDASNFWSHVALLMIMMITIIHIIDYDLYDISCVF